MVKSPKENKKAGLVYSKECIHCQVLEPEWDKFVNKITGYKVYKIEANQSDKETKIQEINASLFGSSLAINGYPTIFKIVGKTLHYFNGDRTADALYTWFMGKKKGGTKRRSCKNRTRRNRKN
jgi:hypothetical protein